MTEHPGDNADTRFRAFWAGVLGFAGFGLVLFLALKSFGPGGGDDSLSKVEQLVVDSRRANLTEVRAAQDALLPEGALENAMAQATGSLAEKKPGKTELVVPNSPTFFKQMTEGAAPTPEAGATSEEGSEEKPAVEKPAEDKPAKEKPAETKAEN